MKLEISYNPYKQESTFKLDGDPVQSRERWVEYTQNKRLQSWFFPTAGWKGLARELEDALNCEKVDIYFTGREIDFSDLKEYFAQYAEKPHETEFEVHAPEQFAKNDQNLRQSLDALVDSLYAPDAPIDELKSPALKEAYNADMEASFEMAVMAPVSSGKSTLINALLGQQLLPTANDSTTAKIARIHDCDDQAAFTVQASDENGDALGPVQPAEKELLKELNNSENVHYLDLYGDIPGVSGRDFHLCIVDTPGPDNSATSEHRAITESVIKDRKNRPLIIYVLDATKPQVDSDCELLDSIAAEIKAQGKEAQDRFIFVMNKADALDENDGDIKDVVERRQKYLAERGIVSTQIIPLSASGALMLREEEHGIELTPRNKKRLGAILCDDFSEVAILTPSCRKQLNEIRQQAEHQLDTAKEQHDDAAKDKAQLTLNLIQTGIIGLELTINEYLDKYAYPYKIALATRNFRAQLQESSAMAALTDRIGKDENALKNMQKELETTEQKHEKMQELYAELENKTETIKFDSRIFEDSQRQFNRELDALVDQVGNRASSLNGSPESARKMIFREIGKKRDEMLQKIKTSCLSDVEKRIDEDFKSLLVTYEASMREIEDNLSITGFDIGSSASLREIHDKIDDMKLGNFEYNKKKYGLSHRESYTVSVKNPEREGFFGFFKFWKPWNITETRTRVVDDGVNIGAMQFEITDTTRKIYNDIIQMLEKAASAEYARQKEACQSLLKQYDAAIRKVIARLKKQQQDVADKKVNLTQNKENLNWLNEQISELNAILDMKG